MLRARHQLLDRLELDPGRHFEGLAPGAHTVDRSYALDVRSVDGADNASGSVWWPFTVDAP